MHGDIAREMGVSAWHERNKIFCFGNEGFSYMTSACVRESVRARDIGMT